MNAEQENPLDTVQIRPEDLVKGSLRLLSLPDTFLAVNRLIEDPRCSGADIARAIGRDPVLTARLLRVANSPLYGFPSRIDTIERALTVIGTRALRDLVLAASAVGVFARMPVGEMRDFWQHSLRSGIAARLLAVRAGEAEPEALFVAGLLHDVGQLILQLKLPEIARETRVRSRDTGLPLYALERSSLGFDHAEVGAELLRVWRLPSMLCDAIRLHHLAAGAADAPMAAAIVCIADILAHECCDQVPADLHETLAALVDPAVIARFDLDPVSLREIACATLEQTDALGEVLLEAA